MTKRINSLKILDLKLEILLNKDMIEAPLPMNARKRGGKNSRFTIHIGGLPNPYEQKQPFEIERTPKKKEPEIQFPDIPPVAPGLQIRTPDKPVRKSPIVIKLP